MAIKHQIFSIFLLHLWLKYEESPTTYTTTCSASHVILKNRFSEKFDSRKSNESKLPCPLELSWFLSPPLEEGNLWHPGYQILSPWAKTPRILRKKVAHGLHFDTSEMEVKIPWYVLLSSIFWFSRSSLMPISAIKLQIFGIRLSLDGCPWRSKPQCPRFPHQSFGFDPWWEWSWKERRYRENYDMNLRSLHTGRRWKVIDFLESFGRIETQSFLLELPFRHLICFSLRLRLECRYGCKID